MRPHVLAALEAALDAVSDRLLVAPDESLLALHRRLAVALGRLGG